MKYVRLISGLVALLTMPAAALQTAIGFDPGRYVSWNDGQPFDGRCVVRVRTTSQEQLDRVLEIAEDVWSERIGQGVLEIDLRRVDLHRLDAIGVPYDMLIDDLQAHADAHAADMVRVRREQLERKPDGFQRGGQVHDDEWFATYRTLDEITQYCENIRALRPDLATIDVIGQSWKGRDMFSITISGVDTESNPIEDRPALFIFSTVHAREWIAPMTTSYIASKLVEDYDTDEHVRMLLDHARVVIVPVGNPDGYLYSWTDARHWRKNRRDNGDGTFGVDINRNWGFQWGNDGSSSDTSNTTYRGTHPFSEPETRALRDVAIGLGEKLVAHIDYHSYSQLVMWPYGFMSGVVTPEPWASSLIDIGTCMSDAIGDATGAFYRPQQSVELYPASGVSEDWFFGALSTVSFIIELRPIHPDFSPPPGEIYPCAVENYSAFKVLIESTALTNQLLHLERAERDRLDELGADLIAFTDTGVLDAEDVVLHARSGASGSFSSYPVVQTERRYFSGELPDVGCGEVVQYYFSVLLDNGETVTIPELGAQRPYESVYIARALTMHDTMESDRGWVAGLPSDSASSGHWDRAMPEGTTHQPALDHSTDGVRCWVTDGRAGSDADEFDVDGGETTIVSPRFSALDESVLSFWFWQNPSSQRQDVCRVGFSNDDGASWSYPPYLRTETQGVWTRRAYRLADYLEPTSTMRVRFSARDVREDSTVELAIDDIAVGVPGCPANAADINADGSLNIFDVSKFIEFFNAESMSADYNGDLEINYFDVAAYLQIFLDG